MRYLIYDIDKHQSSPVFTDEITAADYENADDCLNVIVDFINETRYYCGVWEPIEKRKKEPPQPSPLPYHYPIGQQKEDKKHPLIGKTVTVNSVRDFIHNLDKWRVLKLTSEAIEIQMVDNSGGTIASPIWVPMCNIMSIIQCTL